MARLEKAVKIEIDGQTTKTYHVYEIGVMQILKALGIDIDNLDMKPEVGSGDITELFGLVKQFMPEVTDISFQEFFGMYPSEQAQLLDAFMEVNAPFLKAAKALGLTAALNEIRMRFVNDLLGFAPGSLQPGIGTSSTTGGRSSSRRSSSSKKKGRRG